MISRETPQSQEFLTSTTTWISLIFSKSRDLILISLDRIHYYQVLDRIPWHNDHSHVCGGYLRSTAESSEILCKIGHDLTMIDRDIYVTTPVPFYVNFQFFMCWLFISSKHVEKWWDFDGLLSIYRRRLKIRSWSEFGPKKFDFDRNLLGVLVKFPAKSIHGYLGPEYVILPRYSTHVPQIGTTTS